VSRIVMKGGYVDQLTCRSVPNCMVDRDEVARPRNALHHAIMEHPAEKRAATLLFRLTGRILKALGGFCPRLWSEEGKAKWAAADEASERF
jgi:hypothetical protein